ncbi:hypothetical protein FLK61_26045 [Paenalkalicoccus suaedae]|uniref:Uncharacterized protein n=1 Tax=Paenalkalicoccus suaedae TaxID=2592382 RepID=A0A859FDD8_9BACI|nr:hypothetical protein [Paenalkalicoccus suaedae]QKS70226.1 hypothetical protein FLK61_26045 [Paenalkalicoccus suaedae]
MANLRKACIIAELQKMQIYESRDKRSLTALTLEELEVELVRAPEVRELERIKKESTGGVEIG